VTLSREHSEFAWLSPAAAAKRFVWETQRKGLVALDREVLRAKSPLALERSALLEELTGGPGPRAPRATRGAVSPRRPTARRRPSR
jgi:hypothetical protein